MAERNTDVYHVTVAGVNPHDVARTMGEEGSPFYDDIMKPGVAQQYGNLAGGIVEVWAGEHLTPEQEATLGACPNVIDVRHVWP